MSDTEVIAVYKGQSQDRLALRLAAYFGTSAQFWMNLQTSYDLRMAERQSGAKVKREVRPVQPEPVL